MVFSSQIFIFIFLPIVLALYFLSARVFRNFILLIASLVFYAWGGIKYLPILIISIIINYIFGLLISRFDNIKYKNIFLIIGVMLNLFMLFYYKYYDFTVININSILGTNISLRNIVLPIGISFFTFQGMSYIVDIYRNDGKVNKNILSVALYIALFPQLVAGPIVKYKDIDEQIRNRNESLERFSYGIERFIIGLSKKVIISDVLGAVATEIFSLSVSGIDIQTAWLGAICYTFQIFFDFSGYSDMAIGIGHLFGFRFMENFKYPYISQSITEFWRRWHISLSTWFREYLYIPLGGNRKGNVYVNLLIVFFITGLWHGSSWNFIVWGLWHGLFIIIERAIAKKEFYIKIPSTIKWLITMLIVVIGWVLFNSTSLNSGLNYLAVMFGVINFDNITFEIAYFINRKVVFLLILSTILSTPLMSNIHKKHYRSKRGYVVDSLLLSILFIIAIIFIINSTYSPFIYFQF